MAPNCKFIIDNVESEWPETMYDYIHQRGMSSAISDFGKLFRQAFDHLNPGGCYEIHEFEMPWLAHKGLIPEDSAILRWRYLQEAAKLVSRQFNVARRLEGEPIRAGFEEVKHEVRKLSTTAV